MTNKSWLPAFERARRYLSLLPPAISGQRGHDATYHAACVACHGFALDGDAACALLLAAYNPRCVPPWTPEEILHKVQSAATAKHQFPRGHMLRAEIKVSAGAPFGNRGKWPNPNIERIRRVTACGPTAQELQQLSPFSLDDDDANNSDELVQALFADCPSSDPLLCVGTSSSRFSTKHLSTWLRLGSLSKSALIVPSAMKSKFGVTQNGKRSEHSLSNTGLRRYVVVEFDTGGVDHHAARIWHLSQYAPLATVVHSGNKSLHAWFASKGQRENDLYRFFYYAVSLGADRATWTRSQFVRLPGGTRENGVRQRVSYFNPAAIEGARGLL